MDGLDSDGVLPADASKKLKPVVKSDYLCMLNVQASFDGMIDPDRMKAIIDREVDAGRPSASDDFVQLANAGSDVLDGGRKQTGPGWIAKLFGAR